MNPADLETLVDCKLKALPTPRAPHTLLPRVLAAVQEWTLRPWYTRAWPAETTRTRTAEAARPRTAGAAILARPGFAHGKGPTVEYLAVEPLNRLFRMGAIRELHEREAARASRFAIDRHDNL